MPPFISSIFLNIIDLYPWKGLKLQIMNVIHIWSPLTNNSVVSIWAIFSVESTSSHGPIKWIKLFRTCLSIFQKLNASGVQCTMVNPPVGVNQRITWIFEKKLHYQSGILVTSSSRILWSSTFFNKMWFIFK